MFKKLIREVIFSPVLIVLIIAACTGCRSESSNPVPQQERYQRLAMENAAANNAMTLVSMRTSIRQGENGNLTIRGKPGMVTISESLAQISCIP